MVGARVVHVPKRDTESPSDRLKGGQELRLEVVLDLGHLTYLMQAAATTLHVSHALEEVGQDGISAPALDGVFCRVGGKGSVVEHGSRRGYDAAVIVDIDVNLAAQHQVVAVDERIDQSLGYRALGETRLVDAVVGGLFPRDAVVALDECLTLAQQEKEASGKLGIVLGIILVQARPSRTEQPGMADERFVGKQRTSIGEHVVSRNQPE